MRWHEIDKAVDRCQSDVGHQTAHLDEDEQILAFCVLIQDWAATVERMVKERTAVKSVQP